MSDETSNTVLNVEQLARRWGVNAKTLYVAIRDGQVPALRFGRILRVSIDVVRTIETQGCVALPGGPHGSSTR